MKVTLMFVMNVSLINFSNRVIGIINLERLFMFCRLHQSLLHRGQFEQEFYGDLVYKFKRIMGSTDFF